METLNGGKFVIVLTKKLFLTMVILTFAIPSPCSYAMEQESAAAAEDGSEESDGDWPFFYDEADATENESDEEAKEWDNYVHDDSNTGDIVREADAAEAIKRGLRVAENQDNACWDVQDLRDVKALRVALDEKRLPVEGLVKGFNYTPLLYFANSQYHEGVLGVVKLLLEHKANIERAF